MKKKIGAIALALLILLIGILLFRLYVTKDHREPASISRGLACKAVALALDEKKTILEQEGESHFKEDSANWYVPYMDYLYNRGFLLEEDTKATKESAGDALTFREAEYIMSQFQLSMGQTEAIKELSADKPVPEETWWAVYDQILEKTQAEVENRTIVIYGTPNNVPDAKPWQAFTDQGILGFDGLALDAYMDQQIEVTMRGIEIIRYCRTVDTQAQYKNVWITKSSGGMLSVFLYGVHREFPVAQAKEEYAQTLCDLSVDKGKISKVTLKKDSITGKVLSVNEDSIEIQGYGKVPVDNGFQVYRTYAGVALQSREDILVGYELQKFVVADGKICAALTTHALEASNIRVLIKNSDSTSNYHSEAVFSADVPMTLYYGEQKETLPAGQEVKLDKDSPYLSEGRLLVTAESYAGNIQLKSVQRSQGTPSYRGNMEFSLEPDGIIIVNDLLLEDYLCRVVPSEMPVSYGVEALKVQAVCARTYAYKQIVANACSQYGAHVDDGTTFQVYNNMEESQDANQAVAATYGQVLSYQGDVITAYYFSTSCGHTTDLSIWNDNPDQTPYIKGRFLSGEEETPDLTDEQTFRDFLDDKEYPAYEKSYPWYRWQVQASKKDWEDTINSKLNGVLVQQEDGSFAEQSIATIGELQSIAVQRRGVGGIVEELTVTGTEHTVLVKKQSAIRNLLGNPGFVIEKQDGSHVEGKSSLPSAFLYIDPVIDGDQLAGFLVKGGGFGHGAGLSQNGAAAMTQMGKTYDEILPYFYDGVELMKLYE